MKEERIAGKRKREEKRNLCSTATLVMMLIMVDVDKVVDVADHSDQNQ
jgi:hypothetical protein